MSVVGVGIDLVEVDRIRTVLERRPSFATRVFTAGERADADARRDPAERYAARFAAKEAVLKALGVGLGAASFADIEVVRAESGQPSLLLHGRAAELATHAGVRSWHVSLTHTASLAQAIAIALGDVP